jgi:hypothetical protein
MRPEGGMSREGDLALAREDAEPESCLGGRRSLEPRGAAWSISQETGCITVLERPSASGRTAKGLPARAPRRRPPGRKRRFISRERQGSRRAARSRTSRGPGLLPAFFHSETSSAKTAERGWPREARAKR